MFEELKQTSASQVNNALLRARRLSGSSGLAFTMVVGTDSAHYKKVYAACLEAGREHPSRILIVVDNPRSNDARLDAEVRSGDGFPGDIVTLRVSGELVAHSGSIVLPLLLPDSPTVVWWPNESPVHAADDQLGALGTRRITDAAGDKDPLKALRVRAENLTPGDTDLTWTRLTPWRALLAASLDQYPARIQAVTVEAAKDNAPAELLSAWLQARLGVEVVRKNTKGPGITAVRMTTAAGDIELLRAPGATTAQYSVPGQPKRMVALKRRDINELITEELRRMDADDIFEQAVQMLRTRWETGASKAVEPARPATKKATATKTTAKKATAKKSTAQKAANKTGKQES